jgi:23S rRNA (adenine2030-N6)-methyltransferase
MNYRHAFHAGNFADCFKHAVLLELIRALTEKKSADGNDANAPAMHYFETHAGQGRYVLDVIETEQAEWHSGIGKLINQTGLAPELHRYVERVKSVNSGEFAVYPGSPLLALARLRSQDRLELCELEPEQAKSLTALCARDHRVKVYAADGYTQLKASLPPAIKRGLVLIDPPYERPDEFKAIEACLKDALGRWATGTFAIWYPIKNGRDLAPFYRAIAGLPAKNALIAELCVHPDLSDLRLNGSGMAIINAPYRFEQSIERTLKPLHRLLRVEARARAGLKWLIAPLA